MRANIVTIHYPVLAQKKLEEKCTSRTVSGRMKCCRPTKHQRVHKELSNKLSLRPNRRRSGWNRPNTSGQWEKRLKQWQEMYANLQPINKRFEILTLYKWANWISLPEQDDRNKIANNNIQQRLARNQGWRLWCQEQHHISDYNSMQTNRYYQI